jgi:predicted permease
MIFRDLRFALRTLARSPVFTCVCVLMLGVGIGLAIFMFGAINVYGLKPLPFPQAERLVHVQYTDKESGARNLSLPLIDWLDLRDRQQGLESLAGYSTGTMNLGGIDGAPERLSGAWVSTDAFSILGVRPHIGRAFAASDAQAGASPVALIGERVWQLRFNADTGVVGRTIRVNGTPTTIIGVMPERFAFPLAESIWMPLSNDRAFAATESAPLVDGFGRLRADVSIDQARSEFSRHVATLAGERSEPLRGDAAKLLPFADKFILPQIRTANRAMFVAVLLVLLIACANVASLVLARFAARARELAVRSALGASRRRLIVQVLAETVCIAVAATAIGWFAADFAARTMQDIMATHPAQEPYWIDYSTDIRDVLFAAGIALVAALAAGLVPALRAGRVDTQSVLRQGSGIGERGRLARVLVAGEVALCMVLLVGAGVAIRSSIAAQQAPLGVETDGILTGRVGLFATRYPDAAARKGFVDALEARVAALPGVRDVAFASALPLMGYDRQEYARTGDSIDRDTRLPQAWASSVNDRFFDVFGIALREGRRFDSRDVEGNPPVAIVSAGLAARAWPGRSAIGQRLRLSPADADSKWLEVVGVVADSMQADYFQTSATHAGHRGDGNVFRPLAQQPPAFVSLAVRADGDVAALGEALRDAVRGVDADLPVYWLQPMAEWRDRVLWGTDILAALFGMFAGFALLLAVAGIYAVLAFDVARRSREIGVRRALGADARGVLALIFRRGTRQVLAGLAIGIPLAFGFSRVLAGLMMPGAGSDPRVYAGVVLVLLLAAVAAALVPARRALKVDPMVALRDE